MCKLLALPNSVIYLFLKYSLKVDNSALIYMQSGSHGGSYSKSPGGSDLKSTFINSQAQGYSKGQTDMVLNSYCMHGQFCFSKDSVEQKTLYDFSHTISFIFFLYPN